MNANWENSESESVGEPSRPREFSRPPDSYQFVEFVSGSAPVPAQAMSLQSVGSASLRVVLNDAAVRISVEGWGCAESAAELEKLIVAMMPHGFRDFLIDLHRCEELDARFAGALAGLALRLHQVEGGRLAATNVREPVFAMLSGLGLGEIFPMEKIQI